MSKQAQRDEATPDHPVAWPRPDEGYGTGGAPFFDEQLDAWVVSAYKDVESVLRQSETFSSKWVTGPFRLQSFSKVLEKVADDPRAGMALPYFHIPFIASDGEVHLREHAFVAKAFTPRQVRGLEPTIAALCDDLTEAMLGRSDVPFVTEFAVPLPTKVIASALGLQPDDFEDFKRWSDGFQALIGAPDPTPEALDEFLTASAEFTRYVSPVIEERRRDPGEDIISTLAREDEAGERATVPEILAMCSALLLAGNETSTGALAGGLLYLAQSPGLQAQVRADRSLIPALVEETMRLTTPAQVLFRTATADAEVAGAAIAKGQHVLLRFAAANRDPAQFEDPLRPRLDREDKRHLTFGRGLHSCVGAPLARAELRMTLETLLERSGSISLSERDDAVIPIGNEMTAAVGELYVDFGA